MAQFVDFKLLVDVFGSRMKALEVLCLLNNVKPVVRQGFYKHELQKVLNFCREHHMFIEKSRHTVLLDDDGFFTNRGQVALNDNGISLVYISKDEMKAAQTCLYETRSDHYRTGKMLGYPVCCVRFFCEQFEKANLNPVHAPTNPWTNLLLREKDVSLLSHFPCHSDCRKSIMTARKNFELLQITDKKTAALFFASLEQQNH